MMAMKMTRKRSREKEEAYSDGHTETVERDGQFEKSSRKQRCVDEEESSVVNRNIIDLRALLKSREESRRAQENGDGAGSGRSSSSSSRSSEEATTAGDSDATVHIKVEPAEDPDATLVRVTPTPPSASPLKTHHPLTGLLPTLLSAVDGFDLDNVYTLGETALHYKSLPSATLRKASTAGRKISSSKYAAMIKLNSVTVAACCNATGTNQLPLLVVGKHLDPRCMKHVRADLAVVYKAHNPPWLTTSVCQDWLDSHFKPEVERRQRATRKPGKVLLLLENRAAFRKLESPENVEIRFLAAGEAVFKRRPAGRLDLLTKLKRDYRGKLLELLCSRRSPDSPTEMGVVDLFYTEFDLMDAIRLLQEAWDGFSLPDLRGVWLSMPTRSNSSEVSCQTSLDGQKGTFLLHWMELVEAEEEADVCPKNVINIEEDPEHSDEEAEITYSFETIRKWSQKMPDDFRLTVNKMCDEYYNKYFCKRM